MQVKDSTRTSVTPNQLDVSVANIDKVNSLRLVVRDTKINTNYTGDWKANKQLIALNETMFLEYQCVPCGDQIFLLPYSKKTKTC